MKAFRTLFRRPDRFLFEFREKTLGPESEWSRHVVWGSGSAYRSWWTLHPDGVHEHDSLHRAIAGPTGVSGGSAYRVPTLLVAGGEGRFPLPTPDELLLLRVEEASTLDPATTVKALEDVLQRTRGTDELTREQRSLVEQSLERTKASLPQPSASWESITTYEPRFDAEIDDDELAFEPPLP